MRTKKRCSLQFLEQIYIVVFFSSNLNQSNDMMLFLISEDTHSSNQYVNLGSPTIGSAQNMSACLSVFICKTLRDCKWEELTKADFPKKLS